MNNRIKEVLENLGYESYNITEANNNLFDFFYVLNINEEKYNVIGIITIIHGLLNNLKC